MVRSNLNLSILLPNRNEKRVHDVIASVEKLFPGCQVIIAVDRDSRGKGWAIRKALEYATGDVICFLDSDMDIEPRMILRLLPYIDDYDIVVGTKGLTGIWSRKWLTALSRLYIRALFGLSVDSQTGIKLFRKECIPYWYSDGFLFDVEILGKAQKVGTRMIELPIEAVHSKKMAGKDILKTLLESWKIWLELNSK